MLATGCSPVRTSRGGISASGVAQARGDWCSSLHSSPLCPSPTEQAVRAAVTKHGLYTGSAEGTRVRSQRHLKRLTDLGLIRRLSGAYDGPAEYIHMLAGTTGRGPVFHTLDISELYVRLHERHITNGLMKPITVTAARPGSGGFLGRPCHSRP